MSTTTTTIDPERQMLGEVEMVGRERWEQIHRRAAAGASIRAIARELDLDRKTVRRCLRQTAWKPYQRAARSDTLLAAHAEYLRRRAAEVELSTGAVPGASMPAVSRQLRGEAVRATVAGDAVARGGDAYESRRAADARLIGARESGWVRSARCGTSF